MNDFTRDQMLAASRALPEAVRDALYDSRVDEVIAGLQKTYQLHIDVVDTINKETNYLLLGLTNPAQYAERLRTNGKIPETTVTAIIKEVNEKIFVPLREQMRGAGEGSGAAVAPTAASVAPIAAMPKPQPMVPTGNIVHPPLPTMSTPLGDKVLNRLAPTTPANLPGAMVPKPPMQIPISATPIAPRPPMPMPASPLPAPKPLATALAAAGVPLLSDHEQAHIEFKKVASAPVAPAPVTPPARTLAPIPAAITPAPTAPTIKNYSIDPYREQPEEHEK
jgi:hypothetical protein